VLVKKVASDEKASAHPKQLWSRAMSVL
jgi:hypothetical protein